MRFPLELWNAQLTAVHQGGRANAPALTIDAAMVLVDAALQRFGSARACTRSDVQAAFAWLCSPNVGIAERDGDAIIVRIDGRGAAQ